MLGNERFVYRNRIIADVDCAEDSREEMLILRPAQQYERSQHLRITAPTICKPAVPIVGWPVAVE